MPLKKLSQSIFSFTMIVSFLLSCTIVLSQPAKPNMWVDSTTSKIRTVRYGIKHFLLTQYLKSNGLAKNETDSIFYPVKSFTDMFTYFTKKFPGYAYIRIYIASYSAGGPAVPKDMGNLLTLIFVPLDAAKMDFGHYYSIPPNGDFDSTSPNCDLPKDTFKVWTQVNYIDKKMPILLQTIENTNDNQDNTLFSDTRSLIYPATFIDQLLKEITFQKTNGPGNNGTEVSGIRAFFAAYDDYGNPLDHNLLKNRLILQFELTKKVGTNDVVFYLESTLGWRTRPGKSLTLKIGNETILNIKTLDNGQLCPPYNCPR